MGLDILNPVILKNHKPKGGFCVCARDMIDDVYYTETDFDFGADLGDVMAAWTQLTDPPYFRTHFGMEQWNGSLWSIGGWVSGVRVLNLTRYDIGGNFHETITTTNTPAGNTSFASGVKDGYMYMFGGNTPTGVTNASWRVNLTTGVFESLAPMPIATTIQGCFGDDGKFYAHGDNNQAATPVISGRTFIYDTDLDSWTEGAVGSAYHDNVMLSYNGYIWSIGGVNERFNTYSAENRYYNPDLDIWGSESPMYATRNDHCGVVINDEFFIFGGVNNTTSFMDAIVYTPATDTWETLIDTPIHIQLGEASFVQRKIFVEALGQLWLLDPKKIRKMAIRIAGGL